MDVTGVAPAFAKGFGGARPAAAADVPDAGGWDALTLCVAGYVLTAVGRIHQLFGALEVLHLAMIPGLLAIGLYPVDGRPERRAASVVGPTPALASGLLVRIEPQDDGARPPKHPASIDSVGQFRSLLLPGTYRVTVLRGEDPLACATTRIVNGRATDMPLALPAAR